MRPFVQEELKQSLRNRRLMMEDSWLWCWGGSERAMVLAPDWDGFHPCNGLLCGMRLFPRGNRSRRCLRQRSDRLNIDRYYRNPYTPIKVLRQVADSFAISVQKGGGVLMVLDVRPSLPFSCPRSRFKIRGKLGVWVCRSAPVESFSRIDGMIQVVLSLVNMLWCRGCEIPNI